jgi:hypothetical protein
VRAGSAPAVGGEIARPEPSRRGNQQDGHGADPDRVPANIDGRPLANAILKQAGLPKAF